MNDEEMVLDGPEGQEGGSVDVMERKERYWMRFLKGMVTDRNSNDKFFASNQTICPCFHPASEVGFLLAVLFSAWMAMILLFRSDVAICSAV
jgi:hypothetical protein